MLRTARFLMLVPLVLAVAAPAQRPDAAKVIAARQAGMKEVGKSFKAVNDQLRGGAPDAAIVKANAARLATLSRAVPGWFPRGTGPEAGIKTASKADIWAKGPDFAAKARAFAVSAAALSQAAGSGGDLAAAARQVGQSCKGCHDPYKISDR